MTEGTAEANCPLLICPGIHAIQHMILNTSSDLYPFIGEDLKEWQAAFHLKSQFVI